MHIGNLGSICSQYVLSSFGERTAIGWDRSSGYIGQYEPEFPDFKGFVARIVSWLSDHAHDFGAGNRSIFQGSYVWAFPIETQPHAVGYLREFGFQEITSVRPEKYDHDNLAFVLSVKQFLTNLLAAAGTSGVEIPDDLKKKIVKYSGEQPLKFEVIK